MRNKLKQWLSLLPAAAYLLLCATLYLRIGGGDWHRPTFWEWLYVSYPAIIVFFFSLSVAGLKGVRNYCAFFLIIMALPSLWMFLSCNPDTKRGMDAFWLAFMQIPAAFMLVLCGLIWAYAGNETHNMPRVLFINSIPFIFVIAAAYFPH